MSKKPGLSYKDSPVESVVYLDGKQVGRIMQASYDKGWFYSPKGAGKAKGELMPTRAAVKRSLEGA
jgi:hypothetical protein